MDREERLEIYSDTVPCLFGSMVVFTGFFALVYIAALWAFSTLIIDKTPSAFAAIAVFGTGSLVGELGARLRFKPSSHLIWIGFLKVIVEALGVAILYLFVSHLRGGDLTLQDYRTVSILTGVSALLVWALIGTSSILRAEITCGRCIDISSAAATGSTLFVISTMRLLSGGGA
jgi:hypothetical protein